MFVAFENELAFLLIRMFGGKQLQAYNGMKMGENGQNVDRYR